MKKLLEYLKSKQNSLDNITKLGTTFSKENYEEITEEKLNQKLCFIDGGNAQILGGSGFSLQLIRVAKVFFENQKFESQKKEYYVLFEQNNKDVKVTFDQGQTKTLKLKTSEDQLETIITSFRRHLELKEIQEAYLNIYDGVFEPKNELEKKLFKQKNAKIIGISKTSNLTTDNGIPLTYFLKKQAPSKKWLYQIKSNLLIACFGGEFSFRIDHNLNQKNIINQLLKTTKDSVFLGYPYGLVLADENARVSNEEVERLRTTISKQQLELENSINFHKILDTSKF